MINNILNNTFNNFYYPQQTTNNFYYPQQTTNILNLTVNNTVNNFYYPQQNMSLPNYLTPQCFNNPIYPGIPQPAQPAFWCPPVNNFPNNHQQNGLQGLQGLMMNLVNGLFGSMMNFFPTFGNNFNSPTNSIITIINNIILVGNDDNTDIDDDIDDNDAEPISWTNESLYSASWGDPHFRLKNDNGKTKHAFDFQGSNNTAYTMIDNDDFTLNADFNNTVDEDARVLTDQNLILKGTDVNIVSHRNGKFDIYHNGEKIGDQSNYEGLADDSRLEGIDISYEADKNKLLSVTYNERTIKQELVGSVQNLTSVTSEDEGMLTQLVGALDKENLLDNIAEIDINNDGEISEDEVFNYTSANQALVYSPQAAISAAVKVDENEDYNELASGFLNSAKDHKDKISKVFNGAFEGAETITRSTDSKLTIREDDSEGVIAAKEAMKAALRYVERKISKSAAEEKVASWVEYATDEITKDSENAEGSIANGFTEFDGYSRSQWNELIAEKLYATQDNIFA